jgi:hypothetical protein
MRCSISYIRNSFIFCLIFRCFLIFRNAGRFWEKMIGLEKTQIPSRSLAVLFFLSSTQPTLCQVHLFALAQQVTQQPSLLRPTIPHHLPLIVIGPFVYAWPSILPNGLRSTSEAFFTSWQVLVRASGYT